MYYHITVYCHVLVSTDLYISTNDNTLCQADDGLLSLRRFVRSFLLPSFVRSFVRSFLPSTFEVRRSKFDVRRSMFDVRRSTFDVRRSTVDGRRSMFDVRCPMFDGRRSTFNVRRSCCSFVSFCSLFSSNVRSNRLTSEQKSNRPRVAQTTKSPQPTFLVVGWPFRINVVWHVYPPPQVRSSTRRRLFVVCRQVVCCRLPVG